MTGPGTFAMIAATLACLATPCSADPLGNALASGDPSALSYVRLQMIGPQGSPRCLEANHLSSDSVLQGASFLDYCQNVSGQYWHAQPKGESGFLLFSEFHGSLRCLSINDGQVADIPANTPFMAPCGEGAAVFYALGADDGQYLLGTTVGDQELCLQAGELDASVGRAWPVIARRCSVAKSQIWQAFGGRLPESVPVAITETANLPAGSSATAQGANCLWNDGVSDRPDHFACSVEEARDGTGFSVIGPGYTHKFEIDPEQQDIAAGTLRIGNVEINTGLFESEANNLECWVNRETGERLCVIR